MPIAEIITEIDAYLSRLRQARELLLELRTEAPPLQVPRRKSKFAVGQANAASSSRPPLDKDKSRSNDLPADRKVEKISGYAAARVSSADPHLASILEQTAAVESKPVSQNLRITKLPAKGPIASIRSGRHRAAKPAFGNKLDAIKPAIALAGPMNARVVVVSAEQVERERAARPQIRPQRRPVGSLSGRSAFDALFETEVDPPKTSNS